MTAIARDYDVIEITECNAGEHRWEIQYLPAGVPCSVHNRDAFAAWAKSAKRLAAVDAYEWDDVGHFTDADGNAYKLDGRMMRRLPTLLGRRSDLSDELGRLKTENEQLLVENARLRRRLDRK